MKNFIKDNFFVLCIYVIFLTCAVVSIINQDKVLVHIYLNQFVGNRFVDIFFYYVTYLGDGLVAPFLLLLILSFNVRLGIYSTISFLTATLTSQVLKHCFFDDYNRPSFTFNYILKNVTLKYVDGVERYIHNSFPSGHATQAFSILMCLVFITKNNYLKFLFLLFALCTSMSRVYLSQHWLIDITIGSLIGSFFSILFYYVFIQKNRFENLNKPLSAFKRP